MVLAALYMVSADAKINMIGAGTQTQRETQREGKEKGSAGVEADEKKQVSNR